jgi:hypothetical protein
MKQNHHVDWNVFPIANVWDWIVKVPWNKRNCPFLADKMSCLSCYKFIEKQLSKRPNFDLGSQSKYPPIPNPCPCGAWGRENVEWAAMQILKQHQNA